MPAISVIIPTYNHGDYILQTLDAVFAQTFTDYEVIVINDGSPDNTAEVLRPLVAAGRIRYIEQANQGQGAARNTGIAAATGEFIALLDDDDLWPADKLEWQIAALRLNPCAPVIYGFAEFFGSLQREPVPDASTPCGWVYDTFLLGTCITSPGQTLIRTDVLRSIGGFDTELRGTDDWDLWIRLAKCGPFVYGSRSALKYRYHTGNASSDGWRMYQNARRVVRKHLGRVPMPSNWRLWMSARRNVSTAGSQWLLRQAADFADRGKRWESVVALLRALWVRPVAFRRRSMLAQTFRSVFGMTGRRAIVECGH